MPKFRFRPRRIRRAIFVLFFFTFVWAGAGKQTVFLLPVPSGALPKRAKVDFRHLGLSTLALFGDATARGDLAAGCMGAGIRLA
jgi:hypothetical protein